MRMAVAADEGSARRCLDEAYAPYIAVIGRRPAPMDADVAGQIARGQMTVSDGADGGLDGLVVAYPKGDAFFVETVAVRESARGTGLGRALMADCEARARALSLREVALYTNEKMRANLTLYPHLGFEEVDRREEDGFHRVYFRKVLLP